MRRQRTRADSCLASLSIGDPVRRLNLNGPPTRKNPAATSVCEGHQSRKSLQWRCSCHLPQRIVTNAPFACRFGKFFDDLSRRGYCQVLMNKIPLAPLVARIFADVLKEIVAVTTHHKIVQKLGKSVQERRSLPVNCNPHRLDYCIQHGWQVVR